MKEGIIDKAEMFRKRLEERWNVAFEGDTGEEIRKQSQWLEQEITEEMAAFRMLSQEVMIMQDGLQQFTREYCAAIGEMATTLERIEQQLARQGMATPPSQEDGDVLNFSYVPVQSADLSSENIKQLYRKLAKALHPDSAPENPRATEMFASLNASYASKNFPEMLQLQRVLEGNIVPEKETPAQTLERLEREYDVIKKTADGVKLQKHNLMQSPAYKLQQYVAWYRMCGDDLIARTKAKLEREILRKREMLETGARVLG